MGDWTDDDLEWAECDAMTAPEQPVCETCFMCNGTGWRRPFIARPAYPPLEEARLRAEEKMMPDVRCEQCLGTGRAPRPEEETE